MRLPHFSFPSAVPNKVGRPQNNRFKAVLNFFAEFWLMEAFLIDTHAHIYLPEFNDDREKIITAAKAAGVKEIYLPAIDSTTHEMMFQTEEDFPNCKSMIGLHPCS